MYLLARSLVGTDVADGSYVIALARRMAAGDALFDAEWSMHGLGSAFAVPVVWAWTSLFGVTGVVAAAKFATAAWICVVVALCHRAIGDRFGALASSAALATVMFALPYSLIVTGYNTVPMFGLLLAACCALRLLGGFEKGWAVLCSLATACAVLGFPVVLPGAVALLLVTAVLVRRAGTPTRRVLGALLAPAMIAAALVLLWVTVVPGWGGLIDTLELQRRLRPESGSPSAVVDLVAHEMGYLRTPGKLPLGFLLALIAAVVPWPLVRWTATVLSGLAVLTFAVESPSPNSTAIDGGTYPAQLSLLLILVSSPLVVRQACTHSTFRRLLGLAVLVLPSAAAVQMSTKSGVDYGAAMDGAAPLLLAAALAFTLTLSEGRPRALRAGVVIAPLITGAALTAVVFSEGPVLQHRTLMTQGPMAGLWLSDSSVTAQSHLAQLTARCPPHARALSFAPAAYLHLPPRSAAIQSWIDLDTLPAMPLAAQRDRSPDCIIAPPPGVIAPSDPAAASALRGLLQGYVPAGPSRQISVTPLGLRTILQTYVPASSTD